MMEAMIERREAGGAAPIILVAKVACSVGLVPITLRSPLAVGPRDANMHLQLTSTACATSNAGVPTCSTPLASPTMSVTPSRSATFRLPFFLFHLPWRQLVDPFDASNFNPPGPDREESVSTAPNYTFFLFSHPFYRALRPFEIRDNGLLWLPRIFLI